MNGNVLVCDFSGVYSAEGFLPYLQERAALVLDFTGLEGCCCYCDEAASARIGASLPDPLPRLRFLDSGDYHYMSHLLALKEKEPFHLVLLDHHPDDQEPAFGGVLSCGSWVKAMQEENPLVKSVLALGPENCPEDIPEGWLDERRGERLYVSLDKDIMDRRWARTDWTQGTHTLGKVKDTLRRLAEGGMHVAAVDVCGELSVPKGAAGEDLRTNYETNVELYKHIIKLLNL